MSKSITAVIITASVLTSLSAQAAKYQKPDLSEFLEEFHQNPEQVMDQLPAKIKGEGTISIFSEEDTKDNRFVETKDQVRQKFISLPGRAGFQYNDLAEKLVDGGQNHIRSLGEMDAKNLHSAKLDESPWSDDYWAIAKGVLGARYADPAKNNSLDWRENKDFIDSNPVEEYLNDEYSAFLSPSEKYDLLVGDANFTLTKKMWSEGEYYYNSSGKVEAWMGICHGWAPAAYMLKRPTGLAKVKAANGMTIIFYPSDIKALGSLLWANTRVATRFVGGRCNAKGPKKDSNGRILDQDCFDTNPGTWHKSVINQIGVSKRSFVIDATYDYEVWNQPVYSYEYRYFNVNSYQKSEDWKAAAVKAEDYKKDKFKSYRDRRAEFIVGVEMRIRYVAETHPTHRKFDSQEYDYLNSVTYRYDLEVDASGKIVGGEWYSNAHPDFLWTPGPESRAGAEYDQYTYGEFHPERGIPYSWKRAAQSLSRHGVPLPKIVDGLIEESRKN